MKLTRVGVDLAKQVFQVHGVDRAERPAWCKRLKRARWIADLERDVEPGCEIGMEACGGAHHGARVLCAKGYRVKLIAPQFVKPYVKTNKTDANDAEAICEAMSRPSMRFVAMKTVEQQDLQAVHRVRSSLIRERTAKANQLRGLVYEYGLVAPREISSLRRALPEWLEDAENGLTVRFRALLAGLYRDLQQLDERVRELDREIATIAREHEPIGRLQQLTGIGPLTASALYALVGDARQYRQKNGLSGWGSWVTPTTLWGPMSRTILRSRMTIRRRLRSCCLVGRR
jgi:transposase